MERKIGDCPLGSKCETVTDDIMYVCPWYVKVQGTTASGEQVDEYNCAVAWMPILQLETTSTNRGINSAVNNLRDTQYKSQQDAIQALRDVDTKGLN